MKHHKVWTLALLFAAACSTTSGDGSSGSASGQEGDAGQAVDSVVPKCPPVENSMGMGMAPTPYSAEQIREGNPPGSWKRYRVLRGENVMIQEFEFLLHHEPDKAWMKAKILDEDGTEVQNAEMPPTSWLALQAHASFDKARTLIGRETLAVEAGEFDCWTYAVDAESGEQSFYWFALDLPGPPVLMVTRKDGKQSARMELTALGQN